MLSSIVRFTSTGVLTGAMALGLPGVTFAQSGSDRAGESSAAEQRIDALVRQAAERFTAGGQNAPVAVTGGPQQRLSLDDAVMLALGQNLDIQVERLNPQTFDFSLAALEANYRPSLTSAFTNSNRVTLSNSQLTTRNASTETGQVNWNTGISQSLRWGGSSFAVGWDNRRTDSSNEFATRNPSYTSSLSLSFVQPLLRGFRTDNTRAQLRVTRINQEISEVQLRATITTTLSNVRNAYWDFLFATEALEVARESLALADKLVEDNKTRVEIGTMAPIDVVQAEAEAATRRQTLAQSEATLRTTELTLKRLVVSGTDDPVWRSTLVPTDRPEFRAETIDIEGAVRTALENRTDLHQARRQLDANDVNIGQLGNQTLPALDLNVNYGLTGLGGPQFLRSGLGGTIAETIPGGYSQALNNISGLDAPNWNFTLNLSYPLGTSSAEANLARARLQRQQTEAQLRQLELQVATEVTNAALQVQSNLERVEAASVARELAQRRLEAEQSKFEVGMSTNYFVVQAQRDLRDSQNIELRALLDYQKSLVDFERVQETSGARAGITQISGGGGGNATAQTGGGGGGGFGGGGF